MGRPDSKLDRLLRSAAGVSDGRSTEVPLGFETRVLALWRSERDNDWSDLARFLRRVTVLSAAIMLVSGVFAFRQTTMDENDDETPWNTYAIADNAIQTEIPQ